MEERRRNSAFSNCIVSAEPAEQFARRICMVFARRGWLPLRPVSRTSLLCLIWGDKEGQGRATGGVYLMERWTDNGSADVYHWIRHPHCASLHPFHCTPPCASDGDSMGRQRRRRKKRWSLIYLLARWVDLV
jgi:hypothetical protein